jgi:hypothetical protein
MAAVSNTARSLALIAPRLTLSLAVSLSVFACKREAPSPAAEAIAKGQAPLAEKPFFRVDAKPIAPCPVSSTCEAELVLTALGAYHVNDEYPTKFVPDAASGVRIDGEGTFKISGEKHGTMRVRFTPTTPGTAKLVGTFKLSVCSEENCEIESPKITLDVPTS